MDLYSCLYFITLFSAPLVAYLLLFKQNDRQKPLDWYYLIKYFFAKSAVKKLLKTLEKTSSKEESEEFECEKEEDYHLIYGSDQKGNGIILKLTLKKERLAESSVFIRLTDGNTYRLSGAPEVTLSSTKRHELKTSAFEIQILEPFQRLRILYNGPLVTQNQKTEHFRLNLLWTCAGPPLFHPKDTSPNLLADALASEKWRDGNWLQLLPEETYYEQYGALKGTITLEKREIHLNLGSYRKHFRGKQLFERELTIFGVAEDGTTFNFGVKRHKNGGCKRLKYGNLIMNNGKVVSLKAHELDFYEDLPEVFTVHFKVPERTFKCVVHLNISKASYEICSEKNGWKVVRAPMECDLNAQQARGFFTCWTHEKGPGKITPEPLLTANTNQHIYPDKELVKPLENAICKNLSASGGKASSLALLTSLKTKEFEIPSGFVVLATAFQIQIAKNPKISDAIQLLENIAHGTKPGDLEESCNNAMEIIRKTELHHTLKTSISVQLQNNKNKNEENEDECLWAVRSSALGEDSLETSAAGQNSTYLGCKNEEQIFRAVSKCWASCYSHKSVQYRRQHGSSIKCELAVLIQKMVNAECAGVFFTCDPTTGNRGFMVITSNYGLGESVVSGQSEPDTVTLKRDLFNNISIHSQQIGRKSEIVTLDAENGTTTKLLPEEKTKTSSITKEQALHLGNVGCSIEKAFGHPVDIEWAFHKKKLFILQARPVTTLTSWTSNELLHEFDSAILSEEDTFLTQANIGEVMPGALTTLTRSTTAHLIGEAMDKSADIYLSAYALKSLSFHQQHAFLEFTNMFAKTYGEDDDISNKALDLSVFGHLVRDDVMSAVVRRRYGKITPLKKLKYLLDTLKTAWIANARLETAIKTNKTIHIKLEEKDNAQTLHKKIRHYLDVVFSKMAHHHTVTSRASVFYQFIAMTLLTQNSANSDFTAEHYHDISILFSCHQDIISVELPKKLQKLAKTISDANLAVDFLKTQNAMDFLRKNLPQVHENLAQLLREQGHRSSREFELASTSWSAQPEKLLELVKQNVRLGNFGKEEGGRATVAELRTPKSKLTRLFLKFIMEKSRRAVGRREATKCELIRSVDKLKKAYETLAVLLKREGKLPDVDLIYHLSDHEIGQIINNDNNEVLVRKSLLRRRLYHKWDALKFGEIYRGIPTPQQKDTVITTQECKEVKGTPVCMGEVEGRACVINDVQDAHKLQRGDVLITIFTDTAWSLYFPMLSGIVTELGGLISHGAVVAREFSLPCIVGAKDATKSFKTGDIVHLSGKKGTVRLIQRS